MRNNLLASLWMVTQAGRRRRAQPRPDEAAQVADNPGTLKGWNRNASIPLYLRFAWFTLAVALGAAVVSVRWW